VKKQKKKETTTPGLDSIEKIKNKLSITFPFVATYANGKMNSVAKINLTEKILVNW